MKTQLLFLSLLLGFATLHAQDHSHAGATPMEYPDIPGYQTLVTDLHQHTVFSDGSVWPDIRVGEALREGMDAISLTEHLEYQPHAADIPHPDRNRSHEIALKEAADHDLMIIRGSEITRQAPMGHSNAVFISDANELLSQSAEVSFAQAREQGAFIFWNHPAWYAQRPQGNPVLSDFQKARIAAGELHGIEVINTSDYSQEALAIALEQNLTIMGTSDIHGLIDWDYTEKGNHRAVTLVFARERSPESLREALFAGRTVAVFNELLVGREAYLLPLLKASVEVVSAAYIPGTQVLRVELKNNSSSDLLFENAMEYSFYSSSPVFTLPAGGSYVLQIKTLEELASIELALKALGAYTAPQVQPVVRWEITPE
ncbi:Sb-PDE family phosphodiesterase [Robiginitalea sp. SC105]|uniref:Sb-PDE family phosphodiesterase n=1 Tax=Robiginitalea sp. SC105 TaxID=2762332 RepID=UPI00163A55A1|nr:Sb-PDE family phosphodiesterase [Robiginitalea sp. SC105]MBC2839737.1 PHP domain-containing protein [Robiginitalea sp. SC105]